MYLDLRCGEIDVARDAEVNHRLEAEAGITRRGKKRASGICTPGCTPGMRRLLRLDSPGPYFFLEIGGLSRATGCNYAKRHK